MKQHTARRRIRQTASALSLAGALAMVTAGTAAADSGPLYFRNGNTDCALHSDGGFICQFADPYFGPMQVGITVLGVRVPVPFPVGQVSYEGHPAFPAHPSFARPSAVHAPDGTNPDMADVATGHGTWGPIVEYRGTTCSVGFRASFDCHSGDHGFSTWWGNLAMG